MDSRPIVIQLPPVSLLEVHQVQEDAGDTPWTEESLRAVLTSPNCFVLGARQHAVLLGYVCVQRAADEAHVLNVVVRRSAQRGGVGRALMQSAFERLFDEGIRSVFLEVRLSNAAAQALYAKFGFQRVGVRQAYYRDTGEDALVLRCDIDDNFASAKPLSRVIPQSFR